MDAVVCSGMCPDVVAVGSAAMWRLLPSPARVDPATVATRRPELTTVVVDRAQPQRIELDSSNGSETVHIEAQVPFGWIRVPFLLFLIHFWRWKKQPPPLIQINRDL